MLDPSLVRFRAVVEGALAHLESRRQEINDLNVFPVADGDTGDNMALTLGAVLAELDRLQELGRPLDEIGREEIVESVARAALLGARGNSGVILSQLIRGAAEELISRPGELVDPILVSAAMGRAAQRAYDSVRSPAEGTMLTVMRDMAAAVASELARMQEIRLSDEDPARQNALIAELLEKALAAGEASVRRGPDLLPALKDAGVVDSGGHAVTIIFAGVIAALRGTEAPVIETYAPARVTHPEHDSSTYRYCTNFAVTGADLDAARFTELLEGIGDSVLVVGDHATLKVHVHTDEPEAATGLFADVGEISHLDVADMHEQVVERAGRLGPQGAVAAPTQRCGAVAVVSGDGVRALFASLGVVPLDGGETMNPSTMDILTAVHEVPAEEVVVLPCSPNVIMAAERAAELSEKQVVVVPVRSFQQGLAAAIALTVDRPAAANARAMEDAAAAVRTGGVAEAARRDPAGRFEIGDAVGYVDDELVAWGTPQDALRGVLARLGADAELVTCLVGRGAPLGDDAVGALVPPDSEAELELQPGGQPSWWWLLSAE